MRKYLTSHRDSIGVFMQQRYLPMLDKYAYHSNLVSMFLKHGTSGMHHQKMLDQPGMFIKSVRDYAERMQVVFNEEIQNKHFGNSCSLSLSLLKESFCNSFMIPSLIHSPFEHWMAVDDEIVSSKRHREANSTVPLTFFRRQQTKCSNHYCTHET